MTTFPTFIALSSLPLNYKWHLLGFVFILLSLNYFRRGLVISFKVRITSSAFSFTV